MEIRLNVGTSITVSIEGGQQNGWLNILLNKLAMASRLTHEEKALNLSSKVSEKGLRQMLEILEVRFIMKSSDTLRLLVKKWLVYS